MSDTLPPQLNKNPVNKNPAAPIGNSPAAPVASAYWTPEYFRLWRCLLLAGALVLSLCALCGPLRPLDGRGLLLVIGLTVGVSLLPVALPGNRILIAPVLPIIFAAVGLFGPLAAVIVATASTLVMGLIAMPRRWNARYRARFLAQIVAAAILPDGACALLYEGLHAAFFPTHGLTARETPAVAAWVALSGCTLLGFVTNAVLNTFLSARYYRRRWDIIWHDNARWTMTSAILMSPIGFVMAVLYHEGLNRPLYWWLGLGFVLVPTWAARAAVVYHERTIMAYKQGVELLGRIMQESHPYTHGHLNRVAHWAKKIAEDLCLPPESMQFIEDAAILHDIGKVAVDDRVLNKVGKLTEEDWAMIRRHPEVGAEIVGHIRHLSRAARWIRHHHERPDGSGYPDRMGNVDIPLEAGIISVVDAYDAMVGGAAKEDKRPYRDPLPPEAAVAELRRHSGTQFNAQVVEAFVGILAREGTLDGTGAGEPDDGPEHDSLWDAPLTTALASGNAATAGRTGGRT